MKTSDQNVEIVDKNALQILTFLCSLQTGKLSLKTRQSGHVTSAVRAGKNIRGAWPVLRQGLSVKAKGLPWLFWISQKPHPLINCLFLDILARNEAPIWLKRSSDVDSRSSFIGPYSDFTRDSLRSTNKTINFTPLSWHKSLCFLVRKICRRMNYCVCTYTSITVFIPPNLNTFSDWRRTRHVLWVKTHCTNSRP